MNCRSVRKHLGRYQDGDLPAGRRLELEEHLTSCRACAREQAELRGVVELVESLEEVAPPAHFTANVLKAVAADSRVEPAPTSGARVPALIPASVLLGVAGLLLSAIVVAGIAFPAAAAVSECASIVAPIATVAAKTLSTGLETGSAIAAALAAAIGRPFLVVLALDVGLLLLVLAARKRLLVASPPRSVGVVLTV